MCELNSRFAMLPIKSVNCVILQSLDNLSTIAALSYPLLASDGSTNCYCWHFDLPYTYYDI